MTKKQKKIMALVGLMKKLNARRAKQAAESRLTRGGLERANKFAAALKSNTPDAQNVLTDKLNGYF